MSFFDSSGDADQFRARSKPRRRIGTILLVIFTLGLAAVFVLPSGYVVEQPGPVFNVLGKLDAKPIIAVEGAKTFATAGSFDVLTVNVQGSPDHPLSYAQLLSLSLRRGSVIVPTDEIFPPNVTSSQVTKADQLMMQDSQETAKLVALKHLGIKVPYKVGVVEIAADSPAVGILKLDDKIISVNGKPVRVIDTLPNFIANWAKAKPITLGIIRGSKRLSVEVTPQQRQDGTWRLGIVIANAYKFPFKITTNLGDVGGPSGGMMFTLGIIDKLTKGHLNGGKQIAGTGTIDIDGKVGAIGGIQQKMISASETGAQYFLAPRANCSEVVGHVPTGLEVFSVATIDQALSDLDKIAQGASLDSLPNCSNN